MELHCWRERSYYVRQAENCRDPFTVAVERLGVTVSHAPRWISSMGSIFLRWGGRIDGEITRATRYSEDLPKGGLEIPCNLTLRGDSNGVYKLEKLIQDAVTPSGTLSCQAEKKSEPPMKGLKKPSLISTKLPMVRSCRTYPSTSHSSYWRSNFQVWMDCNQRCFEQNQRLVIVSTINFK